MDLSQLDISGGAPVRFIYQKSKSDPQELVYDQGKWSLDGFDLSETEIKKIIGNTQTGTSSLKRPLSEIRKVDDSDSVYAALGHMRQAVAAGHISKDHYKTLSNHIFRDTMIPSLGNKKAYLDTMSRPRKGAHVMIDLNDFGHVNKLHGYSAGDTAIKNSGHAMRQAIDESVGRANSKAWHISGDEFAAHFPSHAHAVKFARNFKKKLSAITPVGGNFGHSASIGIGNDRNSAEQSLVQAKNAKKAANYKLGEAQTHAHSLVPGYEGHIKLD